MTNALQVARYLIERAALEPQFGPMTNLRLQKLLYYSQMEALVQLDKPVFDEPIMAWIHGPAVESVYNSMAPYEGNPIDPQKEEKSKDIPADELAAINSAWEKFKQHTAEELVGKTHRERPWLKARGSLGPKEKSRAIITLEDIKEFGQRPARLLVPNLPDEIPIPQATIDKLTAYSKTSPRLNSVDDGI